MVPPRIARTGKTVRRTTIRNPRAWVEAAVVGGLMALAAPVLAQTVVGPTTLTIEDALAAHGDWVVIPRQGQVWYPRVGAGWAPQRDGQWQWREPGGWVWMEAAPWGAYLPQGGRWMEIDRRWAWVPQAPPRSVVVPVPGIGPGGVVGGVPPGAPPSLTAPAPRPSAMPGVIRPETHGQPPLGQPAGGLPRITRPPVQEQTAPPVIGAPGPYPGYYPGPMIQRPDAVPPPTRYVAPPPGAAPVPTRPMAPYPPGPAYGTVPMPFGGGTTIVVPIQPQYRSVPGR